MTGVKASLGSSLVEIATYVIAELFLEDCLEDA